MLIHFIIVVLIGCLVAYCNNNESSLRTLLFFQTRLFLLPVHPGDAVLITGASKGIGKHAALTLTQHGYTVFAGIRRLEDGYALLETAKRLALNSSRIHPILLDVTNSDQIASAVDTISSHVGDHGLKGLINNAGIDILDPLLESTSVEYLPLSSYQQVMNVNFLGTVAVTQAFLRLIRQGNGRIVITSSTWGFMGIPFSSPYVSSKFALEGFADSLRRELMALSSGVTVSLIEPGWILTPMVDFVIRPSKEPYTEMEQRVSRALYWEASKDAPSPKVTSDAMVHALRAVRPQIRYVVGANANFFRFCKLLPARWVDTLLLWSYQYRDGEVTYDDLQRLRTTASAEFAL